MSSVVISFSKRAEGNCAAVARLLLEKCGEEPVCFFDFSMLEIHPCGGCSYECFQKGGCCPYLEDGVYEMYRAIAESGRTFFIVPNYCDFPCANFFIFNERSQCFFQNQEELQKKYLRAKKKFIVISNTGKENFITAFRDHVEEGEEPDILFLSAMRYRRISVAGDLMDAEAARADLDEFVRLQEF